MVVRLAEQAEPLPGYTLIEKLGSGGFGEVWKVQAPGGLHKAIKFVHGNLDDSLGGDATAKQEMKAMQRVKALHHPFILSLERVDVLNGQLVIVMELADCNLMDRFKECRKLGLPGIPRLELLRYMEEAAEALDLMNVDFDLQHLDVKPQNLFLCGKHIKVADFGLAKDLDGTHANVTSGITPVYAAPETFEGRVSRFSDQYSLAIVYQELLTGHRPFNGGNARQLLMQHIRMAPDLSPLPEVDRAGVGRALSKVANERHASCLEFVASLARIGNVALPAQLAEPSSSRPSDSVTTSPTAKDGVPAAPSRPVGVSRPTPMPKSGPTEELTLPLGGPARPLAGTDSRAPADTEAPLNPLPPGYTPQSTSRTPVKKPTLAPAAETLVRHCPRCQEKLADRGTLGLCMNCGYASALEDQSVRKAGTGVSSSGIPSWAWIQGGGIVFLLASAMAIHFILDASSLPRAVWGLGQVALGLTLVLAAQICGVLLVGGDDERVSMRDMFFPSIRLWVAVGNRLPGTRWGLYLLSWGLTLLMCGMALGDVTYWAREREYGRADAKLREALANPYPPRREERAFSQEREAVAFLESEHDRPRGRSIPRSDKRPVHDVAIYGVVTHENGRRTFLVAAARDRRLQPVGTIDERSLSESVLKEITARLGSLRADDAPFEGATAPPNAQWLDPSKLGFRVQADVDDKGSLKSPTFRDLLRQLTD